MTMRHFSSYTTARNHLRSLLDAAHAGQVTTLDRDEQRYAVVDARRLQAELARLRPSNAVVVAEGGGWAAMLPGLPVAGDGTTLDDAAVLDSRGATRGRRHDRGRRPSLRVNGGAASRRDHVKFCQTEGWQEVRNARGKKVRHHITYEFVLSSGAILRTRISRPANNDTYGPRLWSSILADQFCVNEAKFWECVTKGVVPVRERPSPIVPAHAILASLAYQLIHVVGLPEEHVAALTKEEAVSIMQQHWSRPGGDT